MPTGQRVDPYANFNFLVEIDGVTRAAFSDATGFDTTIDVHEYREGGENTTVRKLPGPTKYSNIVLKWGLTDDHELYDWILQSVKGNVQRKNGSIVALDLQGNEKVRWNFRNAWPTKWHGPDFSAKGNDAAIETLELAHEGIERAS
jgi:phage tail-like protein